MDDIDALGRTKDGYTSNQDVLEHIQKLKHERLLEMIKIFNQFGTVVKVKQLLERNHIFISYDNKNAAAAAIKDLKSQELRKQLVHDVRERLKQEGRQTLIAPR